MPLVANESVPVLPPILTVYDWLIIPLSRLIDPSYSPSAVSIFSVSCVKEKVLRLKLATSAPDAFLPVTTTSA